MMEYKILKCSGSDKAWLFDLHKSTMKEYVDKIYGWNLKREKAYFDNNVLFKRYHLILDKQGKRMGAVNFYNKNDNTIKINRIEVLPDYQNKGIGSVVLDKIIEKAKKENKNIELRVFKINPAHKLYSRKGFEIFEESETHFYMRYEVNSNVLVFDRIMQEEYDSWGACLPDHKWCSNTQPEVDFIINALNLKKHHTVLDLFCSWGRHVIELKKRAYNVNGMDKSKELIEKANEIAQSENAKVDFIRADILMYDEKERYDIIYSLHSSVFEAWREENEIIEYLKKIYSLLKKDGRYLFGWNNNWNRADSAEKRWKRVLNEKGITSYENDLPFYFYGYDEQRRIIEKCGFKILGVFNNYGTNKTYNSSEPGLVFMVQR